MKKTVWFSADHHFGHDNIRKYCDRPFDSVEEMDQVMIDRWNAVVAKRDTVYYLGDFTLSGYQRFAWYIKQLNGIFNIVPGGHDKRWLSGYRSHSDLENVNVLDPIHYLKVGEQGGHPLVITLCHYPLLSWERSHYGMPHLHGHCHGTIGAIGTSGDIQLPPGQGKGERMDVGVDCLAFEPISLKTVLAELGVDNG